MTRLKNLVKCLLVLAIVWTIAPTDAFAASNLVYYPVEGGKITFDTSSGTITNCDRNVTSAIIPEQIEEVGVVAIQDRAFESCRSLNAISIPDGVTVIGERAFMNCIRLSKIDIPNSVASIAGWAFYECRNLADVYYDGAASEWEKISIGVHNEGLDNALIHFLRSVTITKVTPETVGVELYNKEPVTVYLAICNSAGKQLYHFEQAVEKNAGTVEFLLNGAVVPEGYIVKAFALCQSDSTPLMEAGVKSA